MAYGVVPVVINKGGQKEMIEQGVTGYLWNTEEECIERTKYKSRRYYFNKRNDTDIKSHLFYNITIFHQ